MLLLLIPSISLAKDKITVDQRITNSDNVQQTFGDNSAITTIKIDNSKHIIDSLPDNKNIPEFDGGNIKTHNDKFIELEEITPFYVKIYKRNTGISSFMITDPATVKNTYYIADTKGIIKLYSRDFKGIVIRGKYDFKLFSLHPLVERKIQDDENIAGKNGPKMTRKKPFYIPGENIKIRRKSIDDKTYFFLPSTDLPKGQYVAWIGYKFWIFEIIPDPKS